MLVVWVGLRGAASPPGCMPPCALPLWIPACAGMTGVLGMTRDGGGHPPAFASLRVPLRFSKGEFGFLAALGMTGRGARNDMRCGGGCDCGGI